ncbi:MAG: FAD-dependent oxidoreductase [Alphaproteobacteria bacterium]|nr:FAD-dependent oxidoreductase [Alphaproteobacteria bacterium]
MRGAASPGRVHVVGAGLAGLAAAVALAETGRSVILYEAAPHAGGRCRSYFDAELGCRIDNGNHLLLAGNQAANDYLDRIGARGSLEGPSEAIFPFVDAVTGEHWTVQPNKGALPWWVLSSKRRVPHTRARDYLAALALRRADPSAPIAAVLDPRQSSFRRLWEPLAVAALNTGAEQGSATLFWRMLAETLGRGGAACRPLLPRVGLSESFVEPALARLRAKGAEIRFGTRLRSLIYGPDTVSDLVFEAGSIALDGVDSVILAVPAAIAARVVPGIIVPDRHSPIVNAHFRCTPPADAPFFVGVIGGAAEWIFRTRGMLSVTVSAADRFVERAAPELRDLFWHDVAVAYHLPSRPVPPARIVKERRATFLASPEQLKRRPQQTTAWRNLLLAGDYVDTGLPATIEGAIRSGFAAAGLATDCQLRAFSRNIASCDQGHRTSHGT